ncbi:MAG: hypothetical protein VW518_04360 [Burkholderiaceae bacterium]
MSESKVREFFYFGEQMANLMDEDKVTCAQFREIWSAYKPQPDRELIRKQYRKPQPKFGHATMRELLKTKLGG